MLANLFVFLFLVAVVAAVGFFLSARTAKAALAARAAGEDQLRQDLEAARTAAAEARAEAKERREDATQLKAELERTKKRAFDQQEAAKKAGGAQALREELDKVASRLAEARAEADHQTARARTLEKDLEKVAAELTRAKSRAAEPAPVPAPAPAAVISVPAAPSVDAEKLAAEKDRADKAEARATDLRKKLSEAEKELRASRGRLETEKRVFMVQKGELELAHDRYAELKRRHDGLRKDHEELVDAVRQAAREERQLAASRQAGQPGQSREADTEPGEGQAAAEGGKVGG